MEYNQLKVLKWANICCHFSGEDIDTEKKCFNYNVVTCFPLPNSGKSHLLLSSLCIFTFKWTYTWNEIKGGFPHLSLSSLATRSFPASVSHSCSFFCHQKYMYQAAHFCSYAFHTGRKPIIRVVETPPICPSGTVRGWSAIWGPLRPESSWPDSVSRKWSKRP